MGVSSWVARKALVFAQRRHNATVDPELLAGRAPRWAVTLVRLASTLIVSPFFVWLVCHVLPDRWLVDVGDAFRELIWTDVPPTALRHCGPACPDLVFGMVVLPVTWLVGVVGAVFWYGATKERAEYHRYWLSLQFAPRMTTSAIDSIDDLFRRRPYVPVMFVLSLVFLGWFLPRFVGELWYHLDGRKTVFTTWRFGLLCMIFGSAVAAIGPFFFSLRRMAKRAKT